ncbi:MAG: flagellar biosynthesis anti-sigma factor FlgM [Armatimonadetes bacterium]|nr:flagellar biosynthesis anti-sigma factor FlgM [Armatimonadota bacterium]
MRIENNPIFRILAQRLRGPRPANPASPVAADEVQLSDRAETLRKAKEAYAALPEVREERIAPLKKQIEEGRYQIPERELARRLLDSGEE